MTFFNKLKWKMGFKKKKYEKCVLPVNDWD